MNRRIYELRSKHADLLVRRLETDERIAAVTRQIRDIKAKLKRRPR